MRAMQKKRKGCKILPLEREELIGFEAAAFDRAGEHQTDQNDIGHPEKSRAASGRGNSHGI